LWALPFTLKSVLRQKKNYGNSNISPSMQKYNLQKILSRRNQNPSRYYNNSIITNISSFNTSQKLSSFKNPPIKIDLLLLLPKGQNPLSYYILYNKSKHKISLPCLALPCLGRQSQQQQQNTYSPFP
jgi:hypothetical protein